MPSDTVFELVGVTLPGRGGVRLDVDRLVLEAGVTAVLGPSGAGKTSLLDVLVGYQRPATGRCAFTPPEGAALPLFWSPADGGLWPHLTAAEHLRAVAPDAERCDAGAWLARFELGDLAAALPAQLSRGQAARLGVLRALCSGAAVLVLDEPFAHVDAERAARYFADVVAEVRRRGAALVFATHDPARVLANADEVVCVDGGRVRYQGDVRALYRDPPSEVLARMLGVVNWLADDERSEWTAEPLPRCLRPEQVRLEPSGPLEVRRSASLGHLTETVLRSPKGAERAFLHVTTGPLQIGARVRLCLGFLLLALLCTACLSREEPELPMHAARHFALPPLGTSFLAPRGMGMLGDDRVIVLDNGGRVLVLDRDGKVERQWMMPEYSIGKPEGVCLLRDGRIAVADTHYSRVVFFDGSGNVSSTLGSHGTEPGQFIYPIRVIQDPAGNLYVAEYGSNDRIQKFTEGGRFVLSFGAFGNGPGQFQRPAGMVWHEHRVYVADAVNNRVLVFTDEGALQATLGGDALALKMPYDLALGPEGDLYACEYGAGRVTRFSRTGRLVGRFGTPGLGLGQMRTPWGLTVASDGRVFVADTGNRRIVEWRR